MGPCGALIGRQQPPFSLTRPVNSAIIMRSGPLYGFMTHIYIGVIPVYSGGKIIADGRDTEGRGGRARGRVGSEGKGWAVKGERDLEKYIYCKRKPRYYISFTLLLRPFPYLVVGGGGGRRGVTGHLWEEGRDGTLKRGGGGGGIGKTRVSAKVEETMTGLVTFRGGEKGERSQFLGRGQLFGRERHSNGSQGVKVKERRPSGRRREGRDK